MAALNKMFLIGRAGANTELRTTPTGTTVANLRMAVNSVWKDSQGQKQQRTDWIQVTLWSRLAEIAGQYVRKGDLVFIEGRLRVRTWENQEGKTQYSTYVEGQGMQMLGSPLHTAQNAAPAQREPAAPRPQPAPSAPAPQPETAPKPAQPAAQTYAGVDDFSDDNIPF